MMRFFWIAAVAMACETRVQTLDYEANAAALAITHNPVAAPQPPAVDVPIEAVVEALEAEPGQSPSVVDMVELVYKPEVAGLDAWNTTSLSITDDPDVYQGAIPGDDVVAAGMNYYLRATDTQARETCLPAVQPCGQGWYTFGVTPSAQAP